MKSNSDIKEKILFVCLGNICRSPAADGILREMAKQKGLDNILEIDSAGTYGGHSGELPDHRMRESAFARGYKLNHRSRQIRRDDFHEFDRIIVMDNSNYRNVLDMSPNGNYKAKIEMFCSYCTKHPNFTEVPDPYYEGKKGFEIVLDLLEDGCAAICEKFSTRIPF